MKIGFTVNGDKIEVDVDPWVRLIDILRDRLELQGTREGCSSGECGACTVLMNGQPVASCLVLAPDANGAEIETVEGIADDPELTKLYTEAGAVQCGFCSAGILMAAKALSQRKEKPDKREILLAIEGNLCRCTGYAKIIKALETIVEARS
jgi:carbon-monoxide dehydrogenase small subunit